MTLERDPFRMDLRSAKLCIELDCNTIFDASMYRHCPTCGSAEFYPLESWLNRDRARKPMRAALTADAAAALKPMSRALWLDRLRAGGPDGDRRTVPVAARLRARAALRRRAG